MSDILADLKAVLATTPRRWHDLTQSVSEDLLRRQPAPGEWSALEVLQHLIDLDRGVFPVRAKAILAGQDFPAFFPDKDGSPRRDDIAPAAMAAEFAALRAENLKLIDSIQPSDMESTGRHAELGVVTLSHLLHEWGGHDLMHLVQAEQAIMQPFIDGCGPWQVYFTKHVVSAENA